MEKTPIKAEFLPRDDVTDVFFADESEAEQTAAEKATSAAVEQLSSNAEKGSTIRIYRQLGSGKESMEFIAKYPADKFSIDEIIDKLQHEYGGGDYRLMIYNERGKIAANKLVTIAQKLKPESGDSNQGVYGLLSNMMERQEMFMNRMMNNNGNNSRMEFMQELVVMKNLFAPSGGAGSSPTTQIKETLELMQMLKEEANPTEKETGFGDIIAGALPLFTKMAETAQQPAPQHFTQNPQGRPRPQRRPQSQEPQDMQKLAINKLIEMHAQGMHPADVAENLSAQLPDRLVPQIEVLILGDNAIDNLIKINPIVDKNREWFIDVIEWLKGYLGHDSKFSSEFTDPETNEEKPIEELTPDKEAHKIPEHGKAKLKTDGDTER